MRQTGVREVVGLVAAALIAVACVAQVAASTRSELLFGDGDSLVVALLVRSVTEGEPFQWALSSVLFIPEALVFAGLWALAHPLGVTAVLAINAVVNLMALYLGVRFAAGRPAGGTAPVTWSLIGLTLFALGAITDVSPSRDALDLASLLLTTTYYSATVIAVIVSVGLLRRAFAPRRSGRMLPVILGLVAAVSTLSNPLYAAWATVPLALILAIAAVYRTTRRTAWAQLGWLVGGTVIGYLARIPLSAWITLDGTSYIQPTLWPESVQYYGALLAARLGTVPGAIGSGILLVLFLFCVRQSLRAPDRGARLVATAGWVIPLVTVVGMIALGTHAARYLEPVAFAPVLALVAHPRALSIPRRVQRLALAASVVLIVAAGALSVPRVAAATTAPDPDLTCVTDWITASGRTGAGQFWTVRLPKVHLADPGQLVQVDHQLNAYAWLVNRADFAPGEISYLVEDAQTVAWEFGTAAIPATAITCGRYTIYDFDPEVLPLGPAIP